MNLFAAIPKNVLCFWGKIFGALIYYLDMPHRRIVTRNLYFAYPEWADEEICKVSRRIFQNLGITILEILKMSSFSKEDFLQKVKRNKNE